AGALAASLVMGRRLATVPGAFFLDRPWIPVEYNAVFAGERDEALAAGAPDQGQPGPAREIDAPGGEARARDEDRNAHAYRLDHHLGGEAPGGVEDLVVGPHLVAEHPAGDLVDRVVAADVLHVDQRTIPLAQHAAVDGACLQVERGRGVDLVG